MIEKSIHFLEKHRILNLLLIALYAILIIGLHDFMVNRSIEAMNALGLEQYNRVVAWISLGVALLIILFVLWKLKSNSEQRWKKVFYLLSTLLLMVLHYVTLFEMNIEIIHSLQYGILGFLLLPFYRSIGMAVVLSLPIMLLDEWYQYQVLYPHYVDYFEFNDIVMNIFGLGLLCLLCWIAGVRMHTYTKILDHPALKWLLAFAGIVAVLIISKIIVFYPDMAEEHTFLILNQLENPTFWYEHKFSKAVYHVLRPWEAFAAIVVLAVFYVLADVKNQYENH